jgi:hypothetical protein
LKLLVVVSVLGLVLGFAAIGQSHSNRCGGGLVKGYAAIKDDPQYLVGTLPSKYTRDSNFFAVRYNCEGGSVLARRLDLGTYDVMFPGLSIRMALVTVITDEGAYASAQVVNTNQVRVLIRGARIDGDVPFRRDYPFSIAVY